MYLTVIIQIIMGGMVPNIEMRPDVMAAMKFLEIALCVELWLDYFCVDLFTVFGCHLCLPL